MTNDCLPNDILPLYDGDSKLPKEEVLPFFRGVSFYTTILVFLQGHGMHGHGETVHIPFPFDEEDLKGGTSLFMTLSLSPASQPVSNHSFVISLFGRVLLF